MPTSVSSITAIQSAKAAAASQHYLPSDNTSVPLETTVITDTPAIRNALPDLPLFPKYIHPYLLPVLKVLLPPFTQTDTGTVAGHIASASTDVTAGTQIIDCAKEFWIETTPSTTCATVISARFLGLSVVLLGWASKIPQIWSLLSSAKARMDLPLIPTIVELFGWTLIALYNMRNETFWTAFGEGFGIIVTDIFLMVLWGMQQLQSSSTRSSYFPVSTSLNGNNPGTPTASPEEQPRQYPRHIVLTILGAIALFYYFAWTVLWHGPLIILQGFLSINAPLGLVPVFTLMYTNYSRKRADSIPGLTIIMGWMCGFIRTYTSFVETPDILMRIGGVAGLILPGILVWQVVYYEYICGGEGIPNPKKAS